MEPKTLSHSRRTRKSSFKFKQFEIDQTGCAMKVTSDATLFGGLIETHSAQRILDIGSGTGLLALMLAQRARPTAQIVGVEIDHVAAHKSRENVALSPFKNQIQIHHIDIKLFSSLFHTSPQFDLIVCNPPFYTHTPPCKDRSRSLARHVNNNSLDFASLASLTQAYLDAEGAFWILLPESESLKFRSIAGLHLLHETLRINFCHEKSSPPNRVVSCFHKTIGTLTTRNLVRYDSDGTVTPEVQEILQDYMCYFPKLTQTNP